MNTKKIIKLLTLSLFPFIGMQAAWAENHALVIGIDTYNPKVIEVSKPITKSSLQQAEGRQSFGNLDGAVNDARLIEELLRTRYGFNQIKTLLNQEASREGILKALQADLLAKVKKGDKVVFYYAGHGSQQKNSASSEADKLDETIVPADAYLGVDDIRDKELKRVFNQLLDKGVELTAIFDSCHSGSISRGAPNFEKSRQLAPLMKDLHDGSLDNQEAPEKRGAVVLSAAQSHEYAHETQADVEQNGKLEPRSHGAFTWALVQKLRSTPQYPLSHVVLQVQATLTKQKPVLTGPSQRLGAPFLGVEVSAVGSVVAISSVNTQNQEVRLKAGAAMGLTEGAVLKKADSDLRLEVVSINGLAESVAQVQTGQLQDFQPGDLLRVEKWGGVTPYQTLWMWLSAPAAGNELQTLPALLAELQKQKVQIVEDPSTETPSHSLFKTAQGWVMASSNPNANPVALGSTLKLEQIRQALKASTPVNQVKLFVARPLPQELYNQLNKQFADPLNTAQRVDDIRKASYYLVGNAQGYAWLRPGASFNVQHPDQGAISSLPPRTDWVQPNGQVIKSGKVQKPCPGYSMPEILPEPQLTAHERLFDYSSRLAKVNALLTLNAPGVGMSNTGSSFPYHLALREVGSSQLLDLQSVPLLACHEYEIVLKADSQDLEKRRAERKSINPHYVYILGVNSSGELSLLFPRAEDGNQYNRVTPGESEIPLGENGSFGVVPPYGVDTYLLLSTEEPIPEAQFSAFQVDGVLTRTAKGRGNNPASLFMDINGNTRAAAKRQINNVNWGIEKLPTLSVPVGP